MKVVRFLQNPSPQSISFFGDMLFRIATTKPAFIDLSRDVRSNIVRMSEIKPDVLIAQP